MPVTYRIAPNPYKGDKDWLDEDDQEKSRWYYESNCVWIDHNGEIAEEHLFEAQRLYPKMLMVTNHLDFDDTDY